MTDNKSIVDLYAKVISEQARKEQGIIIESTEASAAKAYASHEKMSKKGYDDLKLDGADGFHHKNSDGMDRTYILKHKSGKHSMTTIAHDSADGKKDYEAASREQNPHLSDDEHKEVAAAIHKNF